MPYSTPFRALLCANRLFAMVFVRLLLRLQGLYALLYPAHVGC